MVQRKNMKDFLAESLIELTKTKQFSAITIKNIAENCGTTTRTFYNHFKDKNDLVSWIYWKFFSESVYRRDGEFVDWHISMFNLLNCIQTNISFFQKASAYEGQNSLAETMFEVFTTRYMVGLVRDWKIEKPSKAQKFSVTFFARGCTAEIINWIRDTSKYTPDELVSLMDHCMPEFMKESS
jgi:hypothetical protein